MDATEQLLKMLDNKSICGSSDSGSESDDDIEPILENGKAERNGLNRLPTRRPNPNVYNRNALLARENRRKKKAYLEEMERELMETRTANKKLKKALKSQMRTTDRLEKEKRFYQSIIANRSEIASLVKALNTNLPLQKANERELVQNDLMRSQLTYSALTPSSEASGRSYGFDLESGAVYPDQSDNDLEPSSAFSDSWGEILGDDYPAIRSSHVSARVKEDEKKNNIREEHSYVGFRQDHASEYSGAGICLHIAHGKVSLEFCPACSLNASGSYDTVE